MAKHPLPSPELLRKLLRYEPETGKLYWLKRSHKALGFNARACKIFNTGHAGKEAFTAIGKHGYHVGTVLGGTLLAHRVILAMRDGVWPPEKTDHDNRVKTDNREGNLEAVSSTTNARNMTLRVSNKSGVCGVFYDSSRRLWRAEIGGKNHHVYLGRFATKEEAITARREAEITIGYHPRHGLPTAAAESGRAPAPCNVD